MPQGSRRTILLAEDDEAVRECILFMLNLCGYNVIATVNGVEALNRIRDCSDDVDLILSDIRMPEMTGFELAAKVQLERPEIKILLMTGFSDKCLTAESRWEVLEKPIRLDLLKSKIQTILQDGPMGRVA